jgi:hypothetical protein
MLTKSMNRRDSKQSGEESFGTEEKRDKIEFDEMG